MAALFAVVGTAFLMWASSAWGDKNESAGKFTEEIVYAQSEDGITNGGVLFVPPRDSAKPIAVIWVHGWGVNFYYPTYVNIGRALAQRGYACISVNTRMHDIGTVAGYHGDKRIRGGGYWGVPSEEARDLAAWINFAMDRGFKGVVLVGHSAGGTAVRGYQANKQDQRVVGLVLASGGVRPVNKPPDPDMLATATRLVADGKGDDLLRFHTGHRPYPSFVSAATFLDLAKMGPELKDFFGVEIPKPPVMRVRCPLLVWFGTKEPDIGTAADLELVKTCVKRQPTGPSRLDTVMIQNADHMYRGEEAQVAQTIAKWADTLAQKEPAKP
jgi:pimeloyl-ACP methyl ester carboxylesterase